MRFPGRLRGLVVGVTALIVGPVVAVILTTAPSRPTATTAVTLRPPAVQLTERDVRQNIELIRPHAPLPPPTPAATPIPAPRPAPKAKPSNTAPIPASWSGDVTSIIMDAAARWGVDGNWMVRIAHCESGLRPNAYNPRGPYYGLFQFLMSTFTHNGGSNIWDPSDQANIAAKMLAHGQAHQWSCA